ncbi:MAG: hypothetical protein OEY89_00265 [Gammaproteobacteria bacterium]|nr:hypothetical protein [Gammaproteobacteria bacterium]
MPHCNLQTTLIASGLLFFTGISTPCLADNPATVTRQVSLESITRSAIESDYPYRQANQPASDQLKLAPGLSVNYLTREAANRSDMMALWPAHGIATHLISCIEGKRKAIGLNKNGAVKYNPSIQSIELATGKVRTLVRGMDRCDGIRATDWGSIIATEEAGYGFVYELIRPLEARNISISDRGLPGKPALTSAPQQFIKRQHLPVIAWEGFTVTAAGVVIAGDELRPKVISARSGGGSIYKFIPERLRRSTQAITQLEQSPLVNGKSYALLAYCDNSKRAFDQDCETGHARWVEIDAVQARNSADTNTATGFYRPEDLHTDPLFKGKGLRFCWANTGNKHIEQYGEVICAIDHEPESISPTSNIKLTRFVRGNNDMNQLDNLAFQPHSGHLYILEDNPNGDIFACLRDNENKDLISDGCFKIASVKDSSAEPTGLVFGRDGTTAYLSIQHSDDSDMPTVDDYKTDDILVISGFENIKKK